MNGLIYLYQSNTLIVLQKSHLSVAALKIEYVDKVTGYSVADLMR